ncbi:hypothetical protein ElyMa_003909500 [Elysia marginata]|uniref:Uncharacterized protein n=1 Tax=Elysia marginata TaxID=1093978 RepID=A0AAV4FQ18_9GAST|nr:hypothetical protein ElyMa_003909500 [Elysia marginata]
MCATSWSPLAARGKTCSYPNRIDRHVATSRPLRPPPYQAFTRHESPASQRFTSALTRKAQEASSFPPLDFTIDGLWSLDNRCRI